MISKQLRKNCKKRNIRKGQVIKNKLKKFTVLYLNIRGIKSKLTSLRNIAEELKPTVMCITETHLIEEEELKIEGYEWFRNDRNKDGGGIAIAMQKRVYDISTIVEKKRDVEEALWVVTDNTKIALRIGVIYAPQESRTGRDEYTKMYESINQQILAAKQKDQKLLLMGDFNCKIGTHIAGNTNEVTKSGRNFIHMIKSNKLVLLNGLEKCEGLWTREDGDTKSVLDYIMVNQEDESAITDVVIDEEKQYAPTREEKNKDVTSDHNTMLAEFNWLFDERERVVQRTVITKKGYGRIKAEINRRKLSKIWKEDQPFEDLYMKWNREVEIISENRLHHRNKMGVKKNTDTIQPQEQEPSPSL